MLTTSARLLELLTLLQVRRDWTAGELAERCGVSARTVRADVARLRELGYPVESRPGVAGGYRLGAGGAMPPLVLDSDEAVAVAAALRAGAGGGAPGLEEPSLRALAKLEQVLPAGLRSRVEAVRWATASVPVGGSGRPAAAVDPSMLGAAAAAVRGRERLRFAYERYDGTRASRHVEPYRLVSWRARWYLVAWDLERADWRVFRVDRMEPRPPTGARFSPRDLPQDPVDTVRRAVGVAAWPYQARVLVHAPAEVVARRLPMPVTAEPLGEDACVLDVGADDPDVLARWVALLGLDVEVLEGDELRVALGRLAAILWRASRIDDGE
ncbi:DNA-binding transcriptional regulator [Cellulomonas chitinilytica]|uniref:DNA-binding transcriptional regulator n=1 Tax=Cellulomonas chitinilytica TaxID=398759 RepID=A0A919P8Q6_9CELL|nr:YafY family protein [Cellulomonas chitinilytica]GIG23641.1 DNA-binding transcriptional regulator [Cellulomonas chitinilytica]